MRHSYHDIEHWASVDLIDITDHEWLGGTQVALPEPPIRTYLVTRVEVAVQYRRHGWGTLLLQQVLDDADAEGAWLVLTCDPDDSNGPDFYELWRWYERMGFEQLHLDHPDMYRSPKSVTLDMKTTRVIL